MAKRIKRFFVFLCFSLFFSLLSGKGTTLNSQKGRQQVSSAAGGLNSAMAAGACCANGICQDDEGKNYCCD